MNHNNIYPNNKYEQILSVGASMSSLTRIINGKPLDKMTTLMMYSFYNSPYNNKDRADKVDPDSAPRLLIIERTVERGYEYGF